jgi:hypothetical protein
MDGIFDVAPTRFVHLFAIVMRLCMADRLILADWLCSNGLENHILEALESLNAGHRAWISSGT